MNKQILKSIYACMATLVLAGCTAGNSQTSSQSDKSRELSGIEQKFASLPIKQAASTDKNRVYYEIFVRSFSDENGDGIGDLKGLTQKLDYLNDGDPKTFSDLGVTGIWLMPINKSPSYHKYDVSDYYSIDPEYGTMDDFKAFIAAAHKRGINVIMDLVVNHTSSQHSWFQDAQTGKNSQYRSYYEWAGEGHFNPDLQTVKWGHNVWNQNGEGNYYALFWDQMPDLNYENPKVRDEIKKVAQYWLKQGVDGFRLDAAMHIYDESEYPEGTNVTEKNIEWWKEFRASCQQINPHVYLAGEVWDDDPEKRAPYLQVFDSVFDFSIGNMTADMINAQQDVSGMFEAKLADIYQTYAKQNPGYIDAPFLSNHDEARIMTELRGDTVKAKLAAGIYMTLPGNPFVYYGEELGMTGGKPDENIRLPFKWFQDAKDPQTNWESSVDLDGVVSLQEQEKDANSIVSYYKKLIRIRQSSDALMKGNFQPLRSGKDQVIAYSRTFLERGAVKDSVIVLHNVSLSQQTVTLDINLSNKSFLFQSTGGNKIDGGQVTIAPQSTVIIR